jgi:tripartite-type tricarboxylate transporter receptor subunit TctC
MTQRSKRMLALWNPRVCARTFLAAGILILLASCAEAQEYPSKPIKFIVPFPPGGPMDLIARLIGQPLHSALGQPIVVENRPGAAGTMGVEATAKLAPDGHTLLITGPGPLTSAPSLYSNLGYDPIKSFAPVTLLSRVSYIVVIHPSVPANSIREFIALAKTKPGQMNFGSGGTAHPMHIAGEIFKREAGVDLVHVPYKGAAPAVADLLAGRTQIMFSSPASFLPHLRNSKLRALAIADSKRTQLLPELPTAGEAGLPGFEISTWFGLLAPSGTSSNVIRRLNQEVVRILDDKAIREALIAQGEEPASSSPEMFASIIASDAQKWSRIIKAANIRSE